MAYADSVWHGLGSDRVCAGLVRCCVEDQSLVARVLECAVSVQFLPWEYGCYSCEESQHVVGLCVGDSVLSVVDVDCESDGAAGFDGDGADYGFDAVDSGQCDSGARGDCYGDADRASRCGLDLECVSSFEL